VDVCCSKRTVPLEYFQRSLVGQLAAEKALSRVASLEESVSAIGGSTVCGAELT
jgi:hypothetical protein